MPPRPVTGHDHFVEADTDVDTAPTRRVHDGVRDQLGPDRLMLWAADSEERSPRVFDVEMVSVRV